ncbi:form3 [Trypoxylus dichotomus]
MDVKSAFLHGKVEEDIYMNVPDGLEDSDGRVCKLNKALYGLKQSPYCWNKRFDEFAEKERLLKCERDPCLYIKYNTKSVIYLLLYVDDILIVSRDYNEIQALKSKLQEEFEMQDLGNLKTFLGINIRRTEEGMYLSQKSYIHDLLKRFKMKDCKESKTLMEPGNLIIPNQTDSTESEVQHKPIHELLLNVPNVGYQI